jgi:hypothetical protein
MRSLIALSLTVVGLACVTFPTGCTPNLKLSGKFDPGVIENSTYTNPTLKFRITWPENWVVADEQTRAEIAAAGADLIAGDDARMRRELNAADIHEMNLLFVGKYRVGAPRPNPNLVITIENLHGRQMDADEYVVAAKQALKQANLPITILGDSTKETIGQTEFTILNTRLNLQGQEIKQRMHIVLREGFAVNFVTTYFDEADLQDLEAIMRTFEEYTPPADTEGDGSKP